MNSRPHLAERHASKGKRVKVLWVVASPEPSSLTSSLHREGMQVLGELGHECQVSDLYAMQWNPVVDRADFGASAADPLVVTSASERAYLKDTLAPDVSAEIDKIVWADAVLFSFPLWWYGMPAILKGWFDRVFVQGFAYRVKDPADPKRTLRYGEGKLSGKRALVLTSCGSQESVVGPRGISGELEEVLFPLLHGTLWYTGMSVLAPVCIHDADRMDTASYAIAAATVRDALARLATAEPIPYRYQNFGDYDAGVLRPDIAPGETGLGIHRITENV